MNGFIGLHRQIIESPVFVNPELLKFWVWCLCKASHKEHDTLVGFQKVHLKKGDFIFGRKEASIELKFNESLTYRCLKTLEKLEMVIIESNNKFSLVSVVNWGKYQDKQQQTNSKRTTSEQQMNINQTADEQQENNGRTTSKQQVNTNNNGNNGNKGNKEKYIGDSHESPADEFFEKIWKLVPSHKNDVKKKVKPARKKQLLEIGYDRIELACENYLSQQKPEFLHKRDNFFNNIIDNYLFEEQPEQTEQQALDNGGNF